MEEERERESVDVKLVSMTEVLVLKTEWLGGEDRLRKRELNVADDREKKEKRSEQVSQRSEEMWTEKSVRMS